MCGEQGNVYYRLENGEGSPPRVRGPVRCPASHPAHMRITPACAGNRGIFHCTPSLHGDHPRVCGEQSSFYRCFRSAQGSPPRVRGTDFPITLSISPLGITPACAGNSSSKRLGVDTGKDHPRVCGEQFSEREFAIEAIGSPPRVRGTEWCEENDLLSPRITPACAGNRVGARENHRTDKDHPRVCGEQR